MKSLKEMHEHIINQDEMIKQLELKLNTIEKDAKKQALTETMQYIAKSKKAWLKMISHINEPEYCEALIIELESRKHQLKPAFKSYTPRGE